MSLSQTKTQARNTTTINGNKPQGKQHKNIHKICTAYPLEALGNLEQTNNNNNDRLTAFDPGQPG